MDGSGFPCQGRAPIRPARPAVASVEVADGRRVQVRALSPQDREAVQFFFDALSPDSRYRRFFNGARTLPESVLHAMTDIDQWRHVALVAVSAGAAGADRGPQIVADARYVWRSEDCSAEFAIAVSDDWQRQGLGSELLRRLAECARQSGVRRLLGYVLKENQPMMALVRALGGKIVIEPQDEALCLAQFDLPSTPLSSHRTEAIDRYAGHLRESPVATLLSAR